MASKTDMEIAEERIEQARIQRATRLDLGDLALDVLPASLGRLADLRELCLGDLGFDDHGDIQCFDDRPRARLKDLSVLAGLTSLRYLDLAGTSVEDLSMLAGLNSLQTLNLASTSVADVSALAGCVAIQHLNLFRTRVTDLSALAGLVAMRSLSLNSTDVSSVAALARLTALHGLALQFVDVTDLSALDRLTELRELDLTATKVTDLSPLAGLTTLQRLDLSSTRATNLSPLARLTSLQNLDLSGTEATDLSPLVGLLALQSLDLSGAKATDLSPLAGLSALQNLNLAQYEKLQYVWPLFGPDAPTGPIPSSVGATDLSPLAGLAALQKLDLSGTTVADLSPLAGLGALQNLDLSQTDATDLSPLAALASLQSLDLSWTGITDLAPLAKLAALENVNLSWTGVTDLSALAKANSLRRLELSGTSVVDMSVLPDLTELRQLTAYHCRLSQPPSVVRDLVDHPNLDVLYIYEIAGVPREVLSEDVDDNCLPRLRAWHTEVDLGSEPENEIKIVLLGNGRVGKTQLCRRFRGERFDATVESTHGVQLWRETLRIDASDSARPVAVNWWDFGGQDIYHGTHALFLRSRAVFVLLWTPELDNNRESDEDGVPLRNQPLAYWLDYVRSLAGADSALIVVQSQCDDYADRRTDPPRPDGFGFFETCAYSARTDLGRETLQSHLREAMRYLQQRTGALAIGRGRAELRRRLYAWRSEDQQRPAAGRRHRTLTREQFRVLCDEVGGIVSWEHALDYLHQTGVVFHRSDLFSDCIILDQDWALDAVYAVFHRGRAVPLLRDSGRFTQADLAALVWQQHSAEEQRLFLGLMESCGVCLPCGATAGGDVRYLAPDLLPAFDSVYLPAWDENGDIATLQLAYRFFHPAIVRSVMRDVASRAGERAAYWKYGLWFKDGGRDTQLRLRFVDGATTQSPGAGALLLEAQGRDPLGLLAEIRRSILTRRIGDPPDEQLTYAGTTVERRALDTVIDGRVIALDRRLVRADAYAAFFDDHKPTTTIDIAPITPSPDEKPREVFISYAWADSTAAGQQRTSAVDKLEDALAADDYKPVRDRSAMRNGERISAFINRLTRADRVVALIGEKYLRSYYCMYEIYRLWQRAQADGDRLLECVVPVVLPDVRIGNLEQREPYLRYWSQQARRLEALVRDPELRPGKESWHEARLVGEFAHHVDDILVFVNDVLMPRGLDDFGAVREALHNLDRQRARP